MAITKRQLEDAIQAWAKRASYTTGGMIAHLMEADLGEEEKKRVSDLIQGMNGLFESLEAHLFELRKARRGRTEDVFAGVWPPSNPRDIAPMWKSLLDDIDAEEMREYCGGDPYEEHPLFPAWLEIDEALHALDPTDPESAQAILMAAKRDEDAGAGGDWNDELLEVATAHAGTGWQP
ncbi:MAG: hypothetical protein ABI673_07805 [Novosphingobium sp.]